jgi:hypothetical protein
VVAQLDATRLRSYHVGDSELLAVGQRGRIKQRVVPHSPTGFADYTLTISTSDTGLPCCSAGRSKFTTSQGLRGRAAHGRRQGR